MARGKPVELATRSFATQALATEFFKAMLRRYAPGERVSDADHLDLAALLERHDEYKQKIGCGLDHFTVMMTEYGTPCFRIVRTDGSGTDFSYRHCVRGRPPSRKQEVTHAFRRTVRFDLYAARDKFFAEHKDSNGLVICAATRERIRLDEAHMDHRPPMTFEVIVTAFLEARGLSLDDVTISSGQDEQVAPEILDADLAEAFRTFHKHIARLDIVKRSINLAQASRQRLKPTRISLTD